MGANILGNGIMEHGGPDLHRMARVRDRVERLVLHFDEFERILSQITVLRDNDGHRISDVANLSFRDWRLLGPHEPRNSSGPHGNGLHIRHVRRCQHAYDACRFGCLVSSDLDDPAMGARAPQNGCVDHANAPNIAHIFSNAAQKLRILNTLYSSTDVSHRSCSPTLKPKTLKLDQLVPPDLASFSAAC